MIELWRNDDPHGRVRCQTRGAQSGGQCLRYQDHGGGHTYGNEAQILLPRTSDEGLLTTFAALTHQMHAATSLRTKRDLRAQRDRVKTEILRRMGP